jgi:hypothetical protein
LAQYVTYVEVSYLSVREVVDIGILTVSPASHRRAQSIHACLQLFSTLRIHLPSSIVDFGTCITDNWVESSQENSLRDVSTAFFRDPGIFIAMGRVVLFETL